MPSGKMWYRRPSKPSRPPLPRSDYPESCLTSLHSRQGLNSTGLNTFWWSHPSSHHIPGSPPHQGKSDFSETHFIQFCTYGNIGPNPTHLSMYHSEENKAPYIHSKKKKQKTKCLASLVTQSVKNPPAMWETWVQSLGWEDPLEKGTAIHSSILAWKIPRDRGAWRATVH